MTDAELNALLLGAMDRDADRQRVLALVAGLRRQVAVADAARGRWKKKAYSDRAKLKLMERRRDDGRTRVALLEAEFIRLKAELDQAVADLEPMRRAESAALDEVLRLEAIICRTDSCGLLPGPLERRVFEPKDRR